MGEKAVPYEEGAACEICWGIGKEFGDTKTPLYVRITGAGFAGACAPCNGTFIAKQVPEAPCSWGFVDGVVSGGWFNGFAFAVASMEVAGVGLCFEETDWKCTKVFADNGASVTIS